MKLSEVKARVDYRMKPLLLPGVWVIYGAAQFAIKDYEWIDSANTWYVHRSTSTSPLEYSQEAMIRFIDSLKRVDGLRIPKFMDEDLHEQPQTPKGASHHGRNHLTPALKEKLVLAIDEDEEVIEVLDEIAGEDDDVSEALRPAQGDNKSKAFVHIESPVKVYVTKDYGLFDLERGNRVLNKTKIKRIEADIKAGTNLLKECPIIVVERRDKLVIVDGQHRFQVCKNIGSYVWYVVRTGLSLLEIAKMNSNTEKWTQKDYLNCYINTGNPDYATLDKFEKEYGYPLGCCAELLVKGKNISGASTAIMEQFKAGKFQVLKFDEANQIACEVEKFRDFERHKGREFVIAITKIMNAGIVPISEVVAAWQKRKDMLTYCGQYKDYIVALEAICNVGKQKRILLIN